MDDVLPPFECIIMKMIKNILRGTILALTLLVLVGGTILAAYSYYANIQVQETDGNSYTYIAIIADVDNDYLSDNNFISLTGLDTRVLAGSTELKHLVADDKVLFVAPVVNGNSTGNYKYTLNNTVVLDYFPIVIGYDGYITIPSEISDDMQLGDDFEIEFEGYVDTSSGGSKNLVYKEDAFVCLVSDTEELSAGIIGEYNPDGNPETTSVDGEAYRVILGGNTWAVITAGAGTDADDSTANPNGDGSPVGWRCDGIASNYDILRRAVFLFDTSSLPDDCEVISATLSLYGNAIVNTGAWETNINIYSSAPASDDALIAADYNTLGVTAFCDTAIAIGSWNTAGYNDFTLNASGIGAVDKTGVSKFGARTTNDVSGVDPVWTASGHELAFKMYMAEQGAGFEPKLSITYGVLVPDIASGVHTLNVYADGTGFGLIVDEGEVGEASDTMTLGVNSVPDNANDIIINQNNVMPYFDYLKWTVSDTLIAWYQPISMIVGTTLDDREGTDAGETGTGEEDGVITWGANPAGVDAVIGSLVSSSQPEIAPASEDEAVDVLPEGEVPAGGVVDTVALEDNPMYFIVEFISDNADLSEEQIWFGGATLIILLAMGVAVAKVPNHLLLAGTIGLVFSGFFVAMHIYQYWMIIIFGFVFVASILMERKPVI
jgi:hypothetical protein